MTSNQTTKNSSTNNLMDKAFIRLAKTIGTGWNDMLVLFKITGYIAAPVIASIIAVGILVADPTTHHFVPTAVFALIFISLTLLTKLVVRHYSTTLESATL